MHGSLDKFELRFVDFNEFVTSDTSNVHKCPILAKYFHLQMTISLKLDSLLQRSVYQASGPS